MNQIHNLASIQFCILIWVIAIRFAASDKATPLPRRATARPTTCRQESSDNFGPPDLVEESRQWHACANLDVFFTRFYKCALRPCPYPDDTYFRCSSKLEGLVSRIRKLVCGIIPSVSATQVLAREGLRCDRGFQNPEFRSSGLHHCDGNLPALALRPAWTQGALSARRDMRHGDRRDQRAASRRISAGPPVQAGLLRHVQSVLAVQCCQCSRGDLVRTLHYPPASCSCRSL